MKNGSLEQQKELIEKSVMFEKEVSNSSKMYLEEILRRQRELEKKVVDFIRTTPTLLELKDEKLKELLVSPVKDYVIKENIVEEIEFILRHNDFDSKLWAKAIGLMDQLNKEAKEQQKNKIVQKKVRKPRL